MNEFPRYNDTKKGLDENSTVWSYALRFKDLQFQSMQTEVGMVPTVVHIALPKQVQEEGF